MKVVLIAALSADGKIAESDDQLSLDWTSKEDLKFFVKKTKECGVVIMGRKTFETIGKPLKDRKLIVMTRQEVPPFSREPARTNVRSDGDKGGLEFGTVEYTNEQPRELIDRLKQEGHDMVAVAGGSTIYSLFLKEGLVTDFYLTVEPVLFGDGIPLAKGFNRINLKLIDVTRLGEQSVLLHFSV